MDYTVHGVTKSQTRLSDFHFHFLFMYFKYRPIVCSPVLRIFFSLFFSFHFLNNVL